MDAFEENKKSLLRLQSRRNNVLYPSSNCNNIYYFLNDFSIYKELSNLDVFTNTHLPIEHSYQPICDELAMKNKHLLNLNFTPLYFYSYPYKIIHAWYTAPLHIHLNHPNIPNFIKLICLREASVLKRKEMFFWNTKDFVVKTLLKIKNRLNCSNDFLCTPYVSHLLGKQLILRKEHLQTIYKPPSTP